MHHDGVPLKGFYAWSLMDNYEWEMGFSERFGKRPPPRTPCCLAPRAVLGVAKAHAHPEPWLSPLVTGTMYTDFNFTTDPNAPNASTPVYDATTGRLSGTCGLKCSEAGQPDPASAYKQTRHAKNSLLWLQWLWQTNALPVRRDIPSPTADACHG